MKLIEDRRCTYRRVGSVCARPLRHRLIAELKMVKIINTGTYRVTRNVFFSKINLNYFVLHPQINLNLCQC